MYFIHCVSVPTDDSDLSSTAEVSGVQSTTRAVRPKRGQYRKYDKNALEMAVNAGVVFKFCTVFAVIRMRYRTILYSIWVKSKLHVCVVRLGTMSVHRAGTFYGVPHSTLEYKVKERTGPTESPSEGLILKFENLNFL